MIVAITISILISMALIIIRAINGPTIYDRILAGNVFGSTTLALIAILSIIVDDAMYIDVALVYALINFVTTIAFLKYFKYRSLGKK